MKNILLYIVATPIGNLGDITLRALEVLKDVDFIACEDTRKTSILLKHYKMKKPLFSFYEYNKKKSGEKIFSLLKKDKSVALVSDAGTPLISDPGYSIIKRAIQEEIEMTIIPGPTACINALVLSGLASHSFIFRGFPPHKKGGRRKFFTMDKDMPYTLIYYESPYRIEKFLHDALEIFGDRESVIVNDLTKLFESVLRGSLSELIEKIKSTKIKGEYVVVIEGLNKKLKKKYSVNNLYKKNMGKEK